jgi:hypothetical protein
MKTQTNIASLIALSGISATSLYAAQPPIATSVRSDTFYNTAMGLVALTSDTTPNQPCVPYALNHTNYFMSGCANTASGIAALQFNTTGSDNTATGAGALRENTTGKNNTAVGGIALYSTTAGSGNAAVGTGAAFSNTTGGHNAALGAYALFSNTTGVTNTAIGHVALYSNLTGNKNTATGNGALSLSTGASGNTADGFVALGSSVSGGGNTASGAYALGSNTNGSGNTAVGAQAGFALTAGNFNTYIGYGTTGITPTDNYVTQIGLFSQPAGGPPFTPTTYIAGIANSQVTGASVYVTSQGQLGVLASSERYKTDIAPLGAASGKLAQLRPVSFHLKLEPNGAIQYGLIAEEVDKVYPELVIRDSEGKIQGVRYDELAPMLLNELQTETARISSLEKQNAAMQKQLADVRELKAELDAALRELKASEAVIAQR